MTKSQSLFNSAVSGAAIAAAFDLGILAAVREGLLPSLDEFCSNNGLHPPTVGELVRALATEGIVTTGVGGAVHPGAEFEDVYRNKGYFMWLIQGYGTMLSTLSSLARLDGRTAESIRRNEHYVALSGKDYGAQFVDPVFDEVVAGLDFKVVADLGCGSAQRLTRLVDRHPSACGVGIDRSADAVALASRAVDQADLVDRISIRQADAYEITPNPEFADVDLLMSFFMGHDLWPRERCVESLRTLRRSFPGVHTFLLCDTYRSEVDDGQTLPIFTMGFELTHAAMGQYIPSAKDWMSVFEAGGWTCRSRHPIGIPFSDIFELSPIDLDSTG